MNAQNTEHTSVWLVVMLTLSHIASINFCCDLHGITTYQ